MSKDPLQYTGALINGKLYRVEDFPFEDVKENGPKNLRKGQAYRFNRDMTKGLFPYRGIIDEHGNFKDKKWNPYTAETGVYLKLMKDGSYKIRISYPKSKVEKEDHQLSRARDIMAAMASNEFIPDQFADLRVNVNTAGESFMPPMHIDDDPLNKIAKLFIRMKDAPFDPYGKRMEALAVDRSRGSVEGTNTRNNGKRSIIKNRAMSASKFVSYGDVFEYKSAIILADTDNSMNPACDPGTALVIFPHGPFDISKFNLVPIDDMVTDAINETNNSAEQNNDDVDEED